MSLSKSIVVLALALVGCGGGGGGGGSGAGSNANSGASNNNNGGVPATIISGVAATGAPFSFATVTATCATGTATGTTGKDGSYSLSATGLTAPCLIKVSGIDPAGNYAEQYAPVTSVAASSVVNVTPITTTIVADASGVDPKTLLPAQF